MRKAVSFVLPFVIAMACSHADAKKPLKFWNLTSDTITELYAQAPGGSAWSANLCLADADHSVDADERLNLPDLAPGTYDVRVVDKAGRHCLFHNVAVKGDGPYAFSIAEDQRKGCTAK